MNFSTVVLTSTRQHYGLIDVDKVSIQDTLSKSKYIRDYSYKLCHIKVVPGDEKIYEDKYRWFVDRGFEVISTVGEWKNDHESHGKGLTTDMAKVYSHPKLLNNEFILNLENDWRLLVPDLDFYLNWSMTVLANNPRLIYHRFSRVDQPDIIDRLEARMTVNDIYTYLINREFSFNPFMSRSIDMRYISNFVLKNYPVHPHVEFSYEIAAKYLRNDDYIFSFTKNGIVEHLGEPVAYNKFINKL